MSQTILITAKHLEEIVRGYLLQRKAPEDDSVARDDLSSYGSNLSLTFDPVLVDETVTADLSS
ncbi:hypothetical protein UFOVP1244_31 [uncultured Caudovirales phage]|uniref:Uncharacterized protein n=1 Tax=uncultured Caudovirales phage TaxID=2100421 RepID=A0A6J5RFW2_9CAUD|nr:hypothetical protein UFOVP1244_31 [uncultured Caudovirales phage]